MLDCVSQELANEFTRVSEVIMNSEFFNRGIRFVFALLNKHRLELYRDMHMTERLADFSRSHLTFVELGIWIENEELEQKFHYFKCIYEQSSSHRREVYLMSISEENLEKWQCCLEIHKEIDMIDNCYETIKRALLKKTQKQMPTAQVRESGIRESDHGFLETIDE